MYRLLGYGLVAALLVACGSSSETDDGGSTSSSSSSGAGAAAGNGGSGGSGGSGGQGTGGMGTGGMGTGGMATGGSAAGGMGQGGMGTGGSSQGQPCTWAPVNPCPNGQYCNAPGCGTGTCTPIGTQDNSMKMPVCGCDGVDYWNVETAALYGMAVASSGQCPQPTFCGGFANLPCPQNNHFCNFDVMNMAGCNVSDVGGQCWGMPNNCSQIGFGGQQRQCNSPNGICMYECDAIKTEQPHYFDGSCPQ